MAENERALAYIVAVDEIRPLPGYDRVEYVRNRGWWCIARKDDFQVGEKAIYFEIDSKVPASDERFKFLESKNYKIKTQKMCKVYSQGLLMPLREFPEFADKEIGYDCTKELRVRYAVEEDNQRKLNNPSVDPNAKYKSMLARHKNLAKKPWFRWLMKRSWGKKLLFAFFGRKKDTPKAFPSWIRKSDETRVENMPWIIDSTEKWCATEKLDGSSCTCFIDKQKHDWDFGVCSRNVRQLKQDQECYFNENIYWKAAIRYDAEKKLKHFAAANGYNRVVIQGEVIGPKIQGNPYKLDEIDFYLFNLVLDGMRVSNNELNAFCRENGFKMVPIIYEKHELPHDMESMKLESEGMSVINPNVKREGLVYRTLDGQQSFKNVSRSYLLKHE